MLPKNENFYYAARPEDVRNLIQNILVQQNWQGKQLSRDEKEFVIKTLFDRDIFSRKKSIPLVAKELKITRQTIYVYLKKFMTLNSSLHL